MKTRFCHLLKKKSQEKLQWMMRSKPKRVKIERESESCVDYDIKAVDKKIGDIVHSNKKIDEDQVKLIWDLVTSLYFENINDNHNQSDHNNTPEFEEQHNDFESINASYENENEEEYQDKHGGAMEWEHMYPIRKSLYNRKTHFISFLQNYTSFTMGRKLMSDYENKMSDFILEEMRPSCAMDFLMMLKECKLSNVYRFYDHIFHSWKKSASASTKTRRFEIPSRSIERIVHVFNMFQAFFHRQDKFNRKNFLSMRFLLGKILLFLDIVKCYDLPVDLKRPKGKSQLLFHEQVWQMFLDSM
jgi:hypothetical protein